LTVNHSGWFASRTGKQRGYLGQNAAKLDEDWPGLGPEANGCVHVAVRVARKPHGSAKRVTRSPYEVGQHGSGMSSLDNLGMDEKISRLEPHTWLKPGSTADGFSPRAGRLPLGFEDPIGIGEV
jgi:hypothetical protein